MYAVPSENDFARSNGIVNDEFVIIYGIFLIFLQVGLACIEASRTRSDNASKIFLKIFLHVFIGCFMQWLVGSCLSYSDGNFFLGYSGWNFTANATAESPQWLYDSLVSITPVTILSGIVLERCNPITFTISSFIISGIIHPISVHWAWTSEGWLNQLGYTDFSGAGVVFAFSGIACFIASLIMGPRKGRFNENSEISPIHSSPILGVGAIFTIIGLLAFNCGALYRTATNVDGGTLSRIISNTIISGTGGCIISLAIGRMRIQQSAWLLSNTVNGCLAGMVAVCANVHTYNGFEALAVGVIGALIFTALHYFLLLLKIDDPIDAFPVYFGGGVWGILAAKIFSPNGMLESSKLNESAWYLLINFTGVMAICLWSIIWSILTFLVVKGIENLSEAEEAEAQVDLSPDSYQDDSCYIEALPYPYAIGDDKATSERDEYMSNFRNSTLRILKMDSNVYENMGLDLELQIRR